MNLENADTQLWPPVRMHHGRAAAQDNQHNQLTLSPLSVFQVTRDGRTVHEQSSELKAKRPLSEEHHRMGLEVHAAMINLVQQMPGAKQLEVDRQRSAHTKEAEALTGYIIRGTLTDIGAREDHSDP